MTLPLANGKHSSDALTRKDKRIKELESVLEAIKGMVVGDKVPNWTTTLRVCQTRCWIADQCDSVLKEDK